MKLHTLPALFFALGCSFMAGAVGSLFIAPNAHVWYSVLEAAPLMLPSSFFMPIWTVMYVLMGVALYRIIVDSRHTMKSKRLAYILFAAQLVLNMLWSIIFFGWHLLWLASIVALLLTGVVVATSSVFRTISTVASYVLWPYVAWLVFITYLATSLAILN